METRSKSRKASEKMPLPGERQGALGAGAECDSEQTTSVEDSEKPATSTGNPELATGINSSKHRSTEVTPSVSLPQYLKTRGPNKTSVETRYKWQHRDNCDILRAYQIATKCETNKNDYRRKTHHEFTKLRPDLGRFTEQNVCDRLRHLVSKPVISIAEQNLIRDEIYLKYFQSPQVQNTPTTPEPDINEVLQTTQTEEISEEISGDKQEMGLEDESLIRSELDSNINLFAGTDPNSRNPLPKIHPNKTTFQLLNLINNILKEKTLHTLDDLQLHAYCAAFTILSAQKVYYRPCNNENENKRVETKIPKWKWRIENKIRQLRSDLTKLSVWRARRDECKQHLKDRVHRILKGQKISQRDTDFETKLDVFINTLKQKVAALGKRLRRYNTSNKRKVENRKFTLNQKQFYQNLSTDADLDKNGSPTQKSVEEFWAAQWSHPADYNTQTPWLANEMSKPCREMEEPTVSLEDLNEVLKKIHNWKSSGPDGIHNFWWKYLVTLHTPLVNIINNIIDNPSETPRFLSQAITYLKPKSAETLNPKNYRPITCLNTIYKILSSIVTQKVTQHIETENVLTEEQKGCRKGSQGCKEHLIIDMVVASQAKKRKRNLAVSWIDYQKAFDSVPHTWLLKILSIYKIHPKLISLLETLMNSWSTKLKLRNGNETCKLNQIPIRRGIFQGDTFSPIWFCLALNPLSKMLNESGLGFKLLDGNKNTHTISHLFYMDDLKLFAKNTDELSRLLEITAQFSKDIQMNFGADKCAILNVEKGKTKAIPSASLKVHANSCEIEALNPHNSYKYLGFHQNLTINNRQSKQQLECLFRKRLHKILETELISKNKVKAINSWCILVLTFSFGVVHWSQTDLENLNRIVRTSLTKYRMHHPKAAVERLYIPRKAGGRGLLDLRALCNRQVTGLKKYFLAKAHMYPLHKAIVSSDKGYTPMNLSNNEDYPTITTFKDRLQVWKTKPLHGRFPHALENADHDASVQWLRDGALFGETEGFIQAIQDQVIATNNYKKHIEKLNVNDKCRICHQSSETIDHITTGCTNLANTQYLHRHNLTANIIHQAIATSYGLLTEETTGISPYYEYQARPTIENRDFKLYYDLSIHTDKTIPANRPDILLHNIKERRAFIIDITHPADHNINKAEIEKISKYIPLSIEYKEIYKLETIEILPIVVTANGLINKNLKPNLEKLKLNPSQIIPKIQKSVILETCRIVRTVLNLPSQE